MTPFDFIKSINQKNDKYDFDDVMKKEYTPFIVNRGFSYFPDTVLYANEMNVHHELDVDIQYNYLYSSIRKKKRFSKWYKTDIDKKIDIVKQYFNYSTNQAKDVINIFSDSDFELMMKRLETGGLKTKKT